MNRRALLVAAGALGVGSVGVSAEDDPDCEETTEIVTGRSGDEVTSTETVPAAWWEQVERAREVQDELGAEFGDESWFEGTGRSSGGREICGRNTFVVTMYASDVDAARSQIDEERDGVPVSVEERTGDFFEDLEGDVADDPGSDVNGDHDGTGGETDGADDDDDPTPGPGVLGTLAGIGTASLLFGKRWGGDRDS